MKHEEKKPEHWFRKHANTIPVQYLPSAVVGAVRNTVFAPGSNKDKMLAIREIIDIYDELTEIGEGEKGGSQD